MIPAYHEVKLKEDKLWIVLIQTIPISSAHKKLSKYIKNIYIPKTLTYSEGDKKKKRKKKEHQEIVQIYKWLVP